MAPVEQSKGIKADSNIIPSFKPMPKGNGNYIYTHDIIPLEAEGGVEKENKFKFQSDAIIAYLVIYLQYISKEW